MNFLNRIITVWYNYFIIFICLIKDRYLSMFVRILKTDKHTTNEQLDLLMKNCCPSVIANRSKTNKHMTNKHTTIIKRGQYKMRKKSLLRLKLVDKNAGIWYDYTVNFIMEIDKNMHIDVSCLIIEYCLPLFLRNYKDYKCIIPIDEIKIKSCDKGFLKYIKSLKLFIPTTEIVEANKKLNKPPNIVFNTNGQFHCSAEFNDLSGEITLI